MRLRAYAIVERAVEEGVSVGWMHAHKHVNSPSAEAIKEAIARDVMGALDEIIEWERNPDGEPCDASLAL